MKTPKRIIGALTALFVVGCLRASSYYVDPATGSMDNPGTASLPWSTLEEVFSSGKTFVAGDVIHLRNGYHGTAAITGHNAGDVTIQAELGHVPRLRKIGFSQASRWVVSGMDISPLNAGSNEGSLIPVEVLASSSFITVKECRIYFATGVAGWSTSNVNSRLGLAIKGSGTDCTFSNNHLSYVKFGIQIMDTALRASVRHNLIEEIMSDGIRFHADDGVFEYNVIKNFFGINTNHDDGIQGWTLTNGQTPGSGTIRNVVIRGNFITNTTDSSRPFPNTADTYGVQGIGLFDGMFENILIENNVVIIDMWHGIIINGAVDCRIVNNTVVKNPYNLLNRTPWITIKNHDNGTPSRGNIIANNIISSVPSSDHLIKGSTWTHNLITTNYTAFFENHPEYNVRLKSGNLAIDSATAEFSPEIDFDGSLRVLTPDLGAYEYTAWPSLAGHWKLDESTGTVAADSSTRGNTGTLYNGPAWQPGRIGGGLAFDGDNNVVVCGSGPAVDNLPALSVSAWILPYSPGGDGKGRIIAKANGTGPVAGWHLHVTDTNQLQFRVDHATRDLDRISAFDSVTLGAWNHVVVTWDGSGTASGVRFYVNGAEANYASGTDAEGSRIDDANSLLYLGNNSTLVRGFDGLLDDVRLYAGALAAGHVAELHSRPPPTITIHPASQEVAMGGSTVLSVEALGAAPLRYQWEKDGTPIVGATDRHLVLYAAQLLDAGAYTVVVSNEVGTQKSNDAVIAITVTYADWIAVHELPEELDNKLATPAGDSVSNLLSYALDLDPTEEKSGGLPRQRIVNESGADALPGQTGYLAIEITRSTLARDLDFVVEVSPDLATWASGSDHTVVLENTPARLIVRDKTPLQWTSRRFIRLRVIDTSTPAPLYIQTLDDFDDGNVTSPAWTSLGVNALAQISAVRSVSRPDGSAYCGQILFGASTSGQFVKLDADGAAWADNQADVVRFWIRGHTSNAVSNDTRIKVQLREGDGGDRWSFNLSSSIVNGTTWQLVTIPLAGLYLDTGSVGNGVFDLTAIDQFRFYGNAVGSLPVTLYIDQIEVLRQ